MPSLFFFFNYTATTEIYTLSLHDALPICSRPAPAQVEDELHHGPPLAGLGLGSALLQRAHELVPLAVGRVLGRSREVAPRLEAILRFAVHEHPPAEQVDLHLGHADLAQAREHLGPDLGVLHLVPRDERGVVAEVERQSIGPHLRTSVPWSPGLEAGRARRRSRQRPARAPRGARARGRRR